MEVLKIDLDCIKKVYKKRPCDSNKGTHGHVLLIAGSDNKIGAAIIASKACLRSGAGLVTVSIPKSEKASLSTSIPEAMFHFRDELLDFSGFTSLGIGYLVFDKGLDLFGGKSSKSIFEGDWYASEYGNPSLKLTTPDILTRIEKNKSVFTHGSIADNLYILVETRPTQEKVDLELELNKALKRIESKGAHSILVDQDDYQTTEGFTGKKAFGSFSMPVAIGEEEYKRVRYEMLLFAQEGAVQQVMVVYKDQDEYAEKVKQKIINSVELKKVH